MFDIVLVIVVVYSFVVFVIVWISIFDIGRFNVILAGLPKSSIATHQRVQNAAARLVLGLGPRDHIADGLRQLHWLPVEARLRYKLCLLMHMVHTGRCPPYLRDVLVPVPVSSSSGTACGRQQRLNM